jgi:hypothetical protein
VLVAGVELAQVHVALPLLEQKLDLPAESMASSDELQGEVGARQVRTEPRTRLLFAGQDHETTAVAMLPLAQLDVEIEWRRARAPSEELGQRLRIRQLDGAVRSMHGAELRLEAAAEPDDEARSGLLQLRQILA